MQGVRTVPQFINWMWKTKLFEKALTVINIKKIADSQGYTFSIQEIRKALKESKVIVRAGILSNKVPLYKQAYPPSQTDKGGEQPIHQTIFNLLDLHPEIRKISSKLFMDGYYQESILFYSLQIN